MKSIGIIDIGSNSMKLVLVKIINDKYFRIIDELKQTPRLGENMGKEKNSIHKPWKELLNL